MKSKKVAIVNSDHDCYARNSKDADIIDQQPSTSSDGQGSNRIDAPKLTSALNALWRMKMNSIAKASEKDEKTHRPSKMAATVPSAGKIIPVVSVPSTASSSKQGGSRGATRSTSPRLASSSLKSLSSLATPKKDDTKMIVKPSSPREMLAQTVLARLMKVDSRVATTSSTPKTMLMPVPSTSRQDASRSRSGSISPDMVHCFMPTTHDEVDGSDGRRARNRAELKRQLGQIMRREMRTGTKVPEKSEGPDKTNKKDVTRKDGDKRPVVIKIKREDEGPSELLDTTASGYSTSAGPQYEFNNSNMEYPPIHQNNNTQYVYANEPSSYSYYQQYSGNGGVHSPGQYILHGSHSPDTADDDPMGAQHATRASPATITWLLENYEPQEGSSLPRCMLYEHYKKHCNEYKIDPVNAASFGKLIRNVFHNLKTRRLGTRGNSKYHYFGIRIKPTSPLVHDQSDYSNIPDSPIPTRQALKRPPTVLSNPQSLPEPQSRTTSNSPVAATTATPHHHPPPPLIMNTNHVSEVDRASLGEGHVPQVDLDVCFNGLEDDVKRLGLNLSHVCKFVEAYKLNCSDVLYCVKSVQFEMVEDVWTQFWQPNEDEQYVSISHFKRRAVSGEDRLSQQQLFSLCTLPQILNFVVNMDLAFYQNIVDILVPNVLMSEMTPMLTQSCRSFAKNAETLLRKAMVGAPEILQKKKMQAVKYMSQGLRRYTSLNHLAQAAKAVLQKQEQVSAMYNDYIKVDISQVQEQAGWVCGCDHVLITQIHNAFKENLQKMVPMTTWADWMESIVDQNVQVLSNFHTMSQDEVINAGRQFLLNWSYYTSMMIRDLTLRSAGSFGSFHLIRLLTDEFMVYLVETRLAKVLGRPMIAVIAQLQPTDYPIFDDAPLPSTTFPSISLTSNYMTSSHIHQEPLYDKYVLSSDQHIEHHVELSQNGDLLSELQSSTDLL